MAKERQRTRANGAGSVEVLPDGRARIRMTVKGKRVTMGPIYESKEIATRMLNAINSLKDEGNVKPSSDVTLATYGPTWLDSREVNGSQHRMHVASIKSERSQWKSWIAPSKLAKIPITNIRPVDVEAYTVWLRQQTALDAITIKRDGKKVTELRPTNRPLSASTQKHALTLVKLCLDHARRKSGLIQLNPAEGIRVAPGGGVKQLDEDWLRQDEIDRLLRCEKLSKQNRTAYACAIGLALRLNDLKSIPLSDVHLNAEQPHIVVLIRKGQKMHRVPIMPWLKPWIASHILSLPKGSTLLFPNPDGGRYNLKYDFGWAEKREKLQRDYRRPGALEIAGIVRRVRFHDLRGTCATMLAIGAWGRTWSLQEVKSMLAHSDQRVTERYVRRAHDALAAAAAATPGPDPKRDGQKPSGGVSGAGSRVAQGSPLTIHATNGNQDGKRERAAGCQVGTQPQQSHGVTAKRTTRMGYAAQEDYRFSSLAEVAVKALQTLTPEALVSLAEMVLADAPELVRLALLDPGSALAVAVLSSAPEPVRLAAEVQQGGAFAVRRGIELAALVIASTSGQRQTAAGSNV